MGKPETDDRFKKFGTVSFTAISKTNDFIAHLEEGRVMGTKCAGCGALYFPPRSDCQQCMTSTMEWFEVAGTGKLAACSELIFGPVGFEEDLPYTIAVLDYGGYKVFGRIAKGIPYDELKVGMELRTRSNTLGSGQLNYVFDKP